MFVVAWGLSPLCSVQREIPQPARWPRPPRVPDDGHWRTMPCRMSRAIGERQRVTFAQVICKAKLGRPDALFASYHDSYGKLTTLGAQGYRDCCSDMHGLGRAKTPSADCTVCTGEEQVHRIGYPLCFGLDFPESWLCGGWDRGCASTAVRFSGPLLDVPTEKVWFLSYPSIVLRIRDHKRSLVKHIDDLSANTTSLRPLRTVVRTCTSFHLLIR